MYKPSCLNPSAPLMEGTNNREANDNFQTFVRDKNFHNSLSNDNIHNSEMREMDIMPNVHFRQPESVGRRSVPNGILIKHPSKESMLIPNGRLEHSNGNDFKILGLGVLGVGIWLLVTEFSVREVSVLIGFNYFEIGTYLMIGAGGTIALLAFLRSHSDINIVCVDSWERSGVYIIRVKDTISNTLQTSYGVDLRKNSTNRLITDAWDSVQRGLECCGVHGDANGTYSWAFYKLHSQWYIQTNMRAPYVPESCCRSGSKPLCTGVETINGPPAKGPPMEASYVKNEFLFTDGCYEKIVKNVERNALILGCVAAFVPLLLIIGIVIVFCLCARVRSEMRHGASWFWIEGLAGGWIKYR
ncbi:CD82-like protein, partial [Mya arenaria]